MIKFFQKLKAKKGFTLVELIVVIAIIGVLAAILVPTMLGYVTSSRVTSADTTAAKIEDTVDTFLTQADTAGYGMSRRQARQLVLHRHFTVNGHTVNIPSFLVKPGDVIEVKGSACEKIKENVEKNASRPVPMWMSFDKDALKVVVNRLPERSEIELDVEEQLIVELYSK